MLKHVATQRRNFACILTELNSITEFVVLNPSRMQWSNGVDRLKNGLEGGT